MKAAIFQCEITVLKGFSDMLASDLYFFFFNENNQSRVCNISSIANSGAVDVILSVLH